MIQIDKFIKKYITRRDESLFAGDIYQNEKVLSESILGSKVLVIGGAGTIGSSFIKALLNFKPNSLVVVDINENGLTELTRDLRSTQGMFIPDDYITYPMSYADSAFCKMFRKRKGFDIVANFSAHKHVRSEKDMYSVEVLLKNNVLNAKILLDLLLEYPPRHFFCVSTDKAANPVNIMGASKKIMEDLIISYASRFKITTARFANVAFSNGSLPAGFLERISKQQPITAPLDVTRYFVSPEESGQICLLACILGNSAEIYFPKLQKENMMTFSSIASKLLEELGYNILCCTSEKEALELSKELKNNSKNYPVFFTISDTTGEKSFEEFYTETETIKLDRHIALGVITNIKAKKIEEINIFLKKLQTLFIKENTSKEEIVNVLKEYLPNFQHLEKGKFLDNKM